jgi:hypothetical protein
MQALASSTAPSGAAWANAPTSVRFTPTQLSAACALLALLTQTQCTTQSGAKTEIETNAQHLEELKKELAEAIHAAQEAANHSGFFGFLSSVFGSDIAKIAGAVAAVAAVVASGGAAGPLVLIALAEGLQLAAKLGPELGIDPKICMALAIAGVAVGLCTGTGEAQAAGALEDFARGVAVVAKVTEGTSTVAGGALGYVAGHYRADQLNHQADAAGIEAEEDMATLDFDDALSLLQRAMRTGQHEAGTASQIIRDNGDTNIALSDRI